MMMMIMMMKMMEIINNNNNTKTWADNKTFNQTIVFQIALRNGPPLWVPASETLTIVARGYFNSSLFTLQ
jgi:hypothetical protein